MGVKCHDVTGFRGYKDQVQEAGRSFDRVQIDGDAVGDARQRDMKQDLQAADVIGREHPFARVIAAMLGITVELGPIVAGPRGGRSRNGRGRRGRPSGTTGNRQPGGEGQGGNYRPDRISLRFWSYS
jgi:hypothetical protein